MVRLCVRKRPPAAERLPQTLTELEAKRRVRRPGSSPAGNGKGAHPNLSFIKFRSEEAQIEMRAPGNRVDGIREPAAVGGGGGWEEEEDHPFPGFSLGLHSLRWKSVNSHFVLGDVMGLGKKALPCAPFFQGLLPAGFASPVGRHIPSPLFYAPALF